MTIIKKHIFLLVVIYLQLMSAFAQNQNIRFDHLSIEKGLSQSTVNDLIQDKKGFIWVATFTRL